MSRIDSLTEIPNRRRFQEYIDDILKVYTRNQLAVSVMLVDVDYFKQYNDNYGHVMGDEVLKKVA